MDHMDPNEAIIITVSRKEGRERVGGMGREGAGGREGGREGEREREREREREINIHPTTHRGWRDFPATLDMAAP